MPCSRARASMVSRRSEPSRWRCRSVFGRARTSSSGILSIGARSGGAAQALALGGRLGVADVFPVGLGHLATTELDDRFLVVGGVVFSAIVLAALGGNYLVRRAPGQVGHHDRHVRQYLVVPHRVGDARAVLLLVGGAAVLGGLEPESVEQGPFVVFQRQRPLEVEGKDDPDLAVQRFDRDRAGAVQSELGDRDLLILL